MNLPGFSITQGVGFHMTFENGWTLSVQFGPHHYCDSKNTWESSSSNAEVAVFNPKGAFTTLSNGDNVLGCQTPAQVLALMNEVSKR